MATQTVGGTVQRKLSGLFGKNACETPLEPAAEPPTASKEQDALDAANREIEQLKNELVVARRNSRSCSDLLAELNKDQGDMRRQVSPPAVFNFEDARAQDADNLEKHEVFEWLKWGPSVGSPCYEALHKYFPGAIPGEVVHARTSTLLQSGRFSFTASNTIFGTSICPDEINSVQGTMVDIMKNHWGGMSFPMGGISGAPFSGKTGFVAFSHHVPTNGNVFVVFGPHVSISAEGQISKCHRRGIEKESTACGAVVGAYNACKGGNVDASIFDMSDMQMSWIKSQIAPHAQKISEHENPMAMLAHQAYEFVKDMVLEVVNNDFGPGNLCLLGGIMINMPEGLSDHFLPLLFQINKKGQPAENLMSTFRNRVSSEGFKTESEAQRKINLYAKMLGKISLFSGVSHYERLQIARAMTKLNFFRGEYIVEKGTEGNVFYVILTGEAMSSTVNGCEGDRYTGCLPDTSEQSLQQLLEQRGASEKISYFGEISGSKNSTHIQVTSRKAVVLALSKDIFEMIHKRAGESAKAVTDYEAEIRILREKDYKQATHHYVFSWLHWSPQRDSICYRTLHDQFPCAIPGPALFSRIRQSLKEFGLTPDNTIFGTSLCPDEINSRNGELVHQMKRYWGENFPLGGISGAPFAGRTGFTAFSHHVPDDGNVIVLFGPHVGISMEGEVGKFPRQGQSKISTACGAAVGAYNACLNSGSVNAEFDKADMQMDWFKQQIAPHARTIQTEENPMGALAHQAYKIVADEVEKVVSNDFGSGWLVLIGVVQINMPKPYFDHFLPLKFEVRNKNASYDLLQSVMAPDGTTGRGDGYCFTNFNFDEARAHDAENEAQHEVFNWLSWAPPLGSPCYTALHKYFPGAVPGAVVHARSRGLLEKYEFTSENTIFGTSICPDEINSVQGTMVDIMKDHWGGMAFPMGGISGAPFSGKTGFVAFSHHVPDDGNVFVVFGPHVSISEEGEVSKCFRRGIEKKSTACGAVVAAYNACVNGAFDESYFDMSDMQMSWIKSQIAPYADQISECDSPMAVLAHQAYEFVKETVLQVVNNNFGTGHLALLGGIMINMPEGHSDHFLPLTFRISKKKQQPEDLMRAFRNRLSSPVMHDQQQATRMLELYAKLLGQVELFKNNSHAERLDVARSLTKLTYYKGEHIMEQGEDGDVIYIFLIGEARLMVDGKEVCRYRGCLRDFTEKSLTQLVNRGDAVVAFGERNARGEKRTATVPVTTSKAVVFAIKRNVFDMVVKRDGLTARRVLTDFDREMQALRAEDYRHAMHHYVFSWLDWSPQPDSICYRVLHDQFPCAIPGPALFSRSIEALKAFGCTPSNTIFGTSLCPDEINSRNGELVHQMKNHWGENFPLGGISGAPFAGKTGFTAFSHHVPDSGNVIVLFGPHVGISADGQVGKFHRSGQGGVSTACGAAVGAYNACLSSGSKNAEFNKADMQMDWFKQQIAPHAERISKEENPMAALAHQAYRIVEDETKKVVSNGFGDGWLVLIGVIQINMPKPYFDHFFPLMFEVRNKHESFDLMSKLCNPESGSKSEKSSVSSPMMDAMGA